MTWSAAEHEALLDELVNDYGTLRISWWHEELY